VLTFIAASSLRCNSPAAGMTRPMALQLPLFSVVVFFATAAHYLIPLDNFHYNNSFALRGDNTHRVSFDG